MGSAANTSVKSIKSILITGGTGLVGQHLSELLAKKGFEVSHLSRNPSNAGFKSYRWDIRNGHIDEEAITSADAIIHLAGAGVADQRWNEARKKVIYDSRIDSTRLLFEKVKALNPKLHYFLSASAIGYYGWDTGQQLVDESAPKGEGFLADVVADWEKEAEAFESIQIPTGKVRIGVVLSSNGGALVEIGKPIKLGVGAPLGSGKQYMSWIHLDDLCGILAFCVENQLKEVVNGVAPNAVTNAMMTKSIARQLKRPLILPNVPKFALKLLVGEMADMLIGGNNVSSKKIETLGYSFQYPNLDGALQDLL